jgi:hypothetical protein
MSQTTLEDRVAALEKQVGALLANHAGTGAKNWRRTPTPVSDSSSTS